MKTSRILSLLSIVGILAVSSCSKKSDDSVTPNQQQAQSQPGFSVKVDGNTYAPDFTYALLSAPGTNGYYAIYGLDSRTSDVVVLALPNTTAEGTYQLTTTNFAFLTYNKEDFSTINGGSGTVTITKKTATNIAGTFSFTAYDATNTKKRTLTEGAFNVPFKP